MATATSYVNMKAHRARAATAWAEKSAFQPLYDEAYDYAIPFRQPAKRKGKGANRVDNLFDDTAITSTFHGAGSLKEDLFPSGQAWFKFQPGPLAKRAALLDPERGMKFTRDLEAISDQVVPFFQTGEFDQAATEMCIDLYAGTGAILPVAGDDDNPVRFVAIPAEEIAIEPGAFGDIGAAFWKTNMSRRAIKTAFPKGKYPDEFTKALEGDGAEQCVDLCQDFIKEGKGWKLIASIDGCDEPIITEKYKTQPIVLPRYHRVPGESYGRGPIMLAMPAIKTSNKAQELTLKAFAIQMLGIWGYRPGGAFNPDTARLAPGAFWAMNSTGGVMGADVQRLDSATGNVNMANLVTGSLKDSIRTALNDDRIESQGKTPVSAAEYVGSLQRMKTNYIGAFGRLIHEIVPTLVRRVMEILYRKGLIQTELKPDALFVQVKVTSPLADAMRIDHLKPFLTFIQLLIQLQQNPSRFVDIDKFLDDLMEELNIPAKYRLSTAQRADVDQQTAQAQASQAVQEALIKKPEIVANALQPQQAAAAP